MRALQALLSLVRIFVFLDMPLGITPIDTFDLTHIFCRLPRCILYFVGIFYFPHLFYSMKRLGVVQVYFEDASSITWLYHNFQKRTSLVQGLQVFHKENILVAFIFSFCKMSKILANSFCWEKNTCALAQQF